MRNIALSQGLWRGRARSALRTPISSARASASLSPGNATETRTVATGQMKRFVFSMLGAVPDSSYFLSFYWQNILAMCSSETTWNLFRHIMVSDFCKKIANFCMTSPQHGRNVKLKKLPCKSPRFLAFFQRLCFYGYLEAFSGKVQESRPCLTFDFTY